ncbi:MAG TPA: hypothetical protein VFA10_28540 [Ktedonobacteraceae bacterium]|nr:hypothetical protein [Ktedonobacteraceae bacterium]
MCFQWEINNGAGQPPSGGPGGGIFDIGTAGPLRLFTQPVASQIVWLLPLALFGMIAVAWQQRPRLQRKMNTVPTGVEAWNANRY